MVWNKEAPVPGGNAISAALQWYVILKCIGLLVAFAFVKTNRDPRREQDIAQITDEGARRNRSRLYDLVHTRRRKLRAAMPGENLGAFRYSDIQAKPILHVWLFRQAISCRAPGVVPSWFGIERATHCQNAGIV